MRVYALIILQIIKIEIFLVQFFGNIKNLFEFLRLVYFNKNAFGIIVISYF